MSTGPGTWAVIPALVAHVLWAVLGHSGSPVSHPGAAGRATVATRPGPREEAPTGGYPYARATCQYGTSGGPDCANPRDPDDMYNWGYRKEAAFTASDPWGYEYRNCTSYVAWRLSLAGVRSSLFADLGNASQWIASVAGEPGVVVSHVPSPGAIAAWVDASGVGHVAWVDSVRGPAVSVSDYNYAGTGAYATHIVASPPTGYIRFPRRR